MPRTMYKGNVSTTRIMVGGWVDRKSVQRGPNGRGLCRWCSLEVPRGRYTFCSEYCVHEWKLRSQPGYLRDQVLLRDRGICAFCGIDTIAAARKLRRARASSRKVLLEHWAFAAVCARACGMPIIFSLLPKAAGSALSKIFARSACFAIGQLQSSFVNACVSPGPLKSNR